MRMSLAMCTPPGDCLGALSAALSTDESAPAGMAVGACKELPSHRVAPRALAGAAQVILEEFGKWLNASENATMAERDRYFGVVFNESNGLIASGSSLKARAGGARPFSKCFMAHR